MFQPVMNGVAGNLVGIQASRISTSLHRTGSGLGTVPAELSSCRLASPATTFLPGSSCSLVGRSARAARVLLGLVLPGHTAFTAAIGLSQGWADITPTFLALYLLAALLQVHQHDYHLLLLC